MKVTISSTQDDLSYKGVNSKEFVQNFSGTGTACSPMETLLMSAAACSSIDLEILLKKMRQKVDSVEVEVVGKRREDITPAKFIAIHLTFKLFGEIKDDKAHKAVEMSLEKMCSVTHSLDQEIEITTSVEVNP